MLRLPPRRVLRVIFFIVLAIILICLVTAPLVARAGGAGGGSSSRSSGFSSSGGSGSGMDLFFLIQGVMWIFSALGPVPSLLIIAGIVILIAIGNRKARHDKGNVYSHLKRVWHSMADGDEAAKSGTEGPVNLATNRVASKSEGMQAFLKRNTGFDQDSFYKKVRTAFVGIQQAWTGQDLSGVRRFISDGVYQRFNTQFAMMRALRQTNVLSDVRILGLRIDRAEADGDYDILHTAIQARMKDSFVCEAYPKLNQSSEESFTEFWSFIRKRKQGAASENEFGDLYQSENCPSCSAALPSDLGERGQCPYCSTLVNSGEYDWILSEITQAEDYAADRAVALSGNLSSRLPMIRKEDPAFCVQLAEDKASNAFMQIIAAGVKRDPAMMRRFVTDAAFNAISSGFPQKEIVYNRLYLNRVILTSISQDDTNSTLDFSLTLSSQRVVLTGGMAEPIDPALRQEEWTIAMTRKRATNAGTPKGSLYMHQCSSCGAPVADSLDTTCPYCSQLYNAGDNEWIVAALVPTAEFQTRQPVRNKVYARIDPGVFERLYDVRDYAFNNLMVMIAADGVFSEEERAIAADAATKLGYKIGDMEALFQMAATGRLALRMPHDVSKREKIIKLMEDTAAADGRIAQEEQDILDYLRKSFVSADMFRF